VGGYDGGQEELYHQMGIGALSRGWSFLTYGGPGQASPRRYQNLGFIPEFEQVVTPVVDYLHTLESVDTSAIALIGLSFGGLLAPRAAAFEHRLKAVICLDGLYEFGGLVLQKIPVALNTLFASGNSTAFNTTITTYLSSPTAGTQFRWFVQQGMWAVDTTSPSIWMTQLQAYTLEDLIAKIPGPVFSADSATDAFFLGQGKELADKLGERATYHEFDVGSAVGHAGVGGYRLQNQVVYDWFQGVIDEC
jgi:hypothetical protein